MGERRGGRRGNEMAAAADVGWARPVAEVEAWLDAAGPRMIDRRTATQPGLSFHLLVASASRGVRGEPSNLWSAGAGSGWVFSVRPLAPTTVRVSRAARSAMSVDVSHRPHNVPSPACGLQGQRRPANGG
jgi:hypothetical protein